MAIITVIIIAIIIVMISGFITQLRCFFLPLIRKEILRIRKSRILKENSLQYVHSTL